MNTDICGEKQAEMLKEYTTGYKAFLLFGFGAVNPNPYGSKLWQHWLDGASAGNYHQMMIESRRLITRLEDAQKNVNASVKKQAKAKEYVKSLISNNTSPKIVALYQEKLDSMTAVTFRASRRFEEIMKEICDRANKHLNWNIEQGARAND